MVLEKRKKDFIETFPGFMVIIGSAGLVVALLFFLVYAADKNLDKVEALNEKQEAKEEAIEQNQLELVSDELGLPTKNILFVRTISNSYENEVFEYRTDKHTYLVQFEGEQLKTIVKSEEDHD